MTHESLPQELKDYLSWLVENERSKTEAAYKNNPVGSMLMYSGALLNWIGEYLSDPSLTWTKKTLRIDELTLTGTNPEWNKIVIEKAERNPQKLRELMKDPKIREVFESVVFRPDPILVRVDKTSEGRKLKVLDGMSRVLSSIRDGKEEIEAWIAERKGSSQPEIEPHVIYDFLRAFDQGRGKKGDLLSALRFLLDAYSNTQELLQDRFNSEWVLNPEINEAIKELLMEKEY